MKRIIILFFAIGIMASCTGCQKIKNIFIKPPEGVVQKSYTIPVYGYQSSLVVKTTPQELTEYFVKDLSRFERVSGVLQIEFRDLSPDADMTRVGQSFFLDAKILGLNFSCQLITFKCRLNEELWVMVLTDGNWLLFRFESKPVPEGSMVRLNILNRPSKTLAAILDTFHLGEAIAAKIDLLMAFVQSEFDPELDVKELTEKGLRGEAYEKFLQAYEASVWVDAGPENVARWIIANLDSCMPEIKVKGDCSSYKVFAELSEREVRHCPGAIEFGNLKVDVNTFLLWRTEGKERIYRVYLEGLNQMGFIQLGVRPEAGGSRVRGMVVSDIPGSASPRIMDIMMALTGIPKQMSEILLDIKQGVEGVG